MHYNIQQTEQKITWGTELLNNKSKGLELNIIEHFSLKESKPCFKFHKVIEIRDSKLPCPIHQNHFLKLEASLGAYKNNNNKKKTSLGHITSPIKVHTIL